MTVQDTTPEAGSDDLGQLLALGKFSEFHLAKARKALAAGEFKDAVYQARASLSHDPSNAEAKAVKTEAAGKMK